MLYAMINFFVALYLYNIHKNPVKYIHSTWIIPLLWIFLSWLMRDSYHWDKSLAWPWTYTLFFILTGMTICFATMIFVAHFPNPLSQKYNKPMFNQSLFVLISILSISLFIIDFTME